MKKKFQAILLVALIMIAFLTEGFPLGKMFKVQTVKAASTYDADAAIVYAKAHWNDGQGLCAEFVSRCVRAGGFNIPVIQGCKELYQQMVAKSGTAAKDLILNNKGYATQSDNGKWLSAGDVVILWCYKCNLRPHALLCGGYNKNGNATFYAHNDSINNEEYQLNQSVLHPGHNVGAKVIHISSLSPIHSDNVNIQVTTDGVRDIVGNTAVVYGTCMKDSDINISSCGIYFGTDANSLSKLNTEKVSAGTNRYNNGSSFSIWYDLRGELGQSLSGGATYYYQFYCVYAGNEYKGSVKSFSLPSAYTMQNYKVRVVRPAYTTVLLYPTVESDKSSASLEAKDSKAYIDCDKYAVFSDGRKRFHFSSNGKDYWFDFSSGMEEEFFLQSAIIDLPEHITISTEDEPLKFKLITTPLFANEYLKVEVSGGIGVGVRPESWAEGWRGKAFQIYAEGKSGTGTVRLVGTKSGVVSNSITVTIKDDTAPNLAEKKMEEISDGYRIRVAAVDNYGYGMIKDIGAKSWLAGDEVESVQTIWRSEHPEKFSLTPRDGSSWIDISHEVSFFDHADRYGEYYTTLYVKDDSGNIQEETFYYRRKGSENISTVQPSVYPTAIPTVSPEATMAPQPSITPSTTPTIQPTVSPSAASTIQPTISPSSVPTIQPTNLPNVTPTEPPFIIDESMPMVVITSIVPDVEYIQFYWLFCTFGR